MDPLQVNRVGSQKEDVAPEGSLHSVAAPRRRRRVTALAVVSALLTAALAAAPAASGASTLLCKGLVACLLAGRDTAGYSVLGLQSYWNQTPGHNCTNYVAFRLTHAGRLVARPPGTGTAYTWGDASRKAGVPVDDRPSVGAVAWWTAARMGNSTGHVAYVEEVRADGSIVVSEDNLGGDFDWRRVTRDAKWPSGFIHFPKSDGSPFGRFDSVSAPVAGQIDFWGTSGDPDSALLVLPVDPSYLITLGGPRGTPGIESFTFTSPYFNFHRTKTVRTRGPTTMYLYALNTPLSKGRDVLLGARPVTIRDTSKTTAEMVDATIKAATVPKMKVTLAPTTATGRVDIVRGSTVLTSLTFGSGGTRTITVSLPKQVKGTHRLSARYAGSTRHLPSTAAVTLTVS
jgi:surface antigen